jgi:hypothetical protein
MNHSNSFPVTTPSYRPALSVPSHSCNISPLKKIQNTLYFKQKILEKKWLVFKQHKRLTRNWKKPSHSSLHWKFVIIYFTNTHSYLETSPHFQCILAFLYLNIFTDVSVFIYQTVKQQQSHDFLVNFRVIL